MIKRRFSELDDTHEQESSFSLIADFDGNEEQLFEEEIDKCLFCRYAIWCCSRE